MVIYSRQCQDYISRHNIWVKTVNEMTHSVLSRENTRPNGMSGQILFCMRPYQMR